MKSACALLVRTRKASLASHVNVRNGQVVTPPVTLPTTGVPEPETLALTGLGLLGLALSPRRRQSK